MKYNEQEILKQISEYISSTYGAHYSKHGIQTLDLIDSVGDAEAFCRSNILKYASRYDRKGTARKDLFKIVHYAVLLLHFSDKSASCLLYTSPSPRDRQKYPNPSSA